MKFRSWTSGAGIAAVLVMGGCSASSNHEPQDAEPAGHASAEREATEVEIEATDLPAVVRAGFDKTYPAATINKVQKETYRNGMIHYEFEFTNREGQQRDAAFDANGELLPEH